jgi:sterol desaturase/sphingolipid hydroxylase (fatty acid hydroxylase superfamily)
VSTNSWKQFTPFYFYTAVAVSLGGAALMGDNRRTFSAILLLFVCGILSWALVEYVLHRFVFHYRSHDEAPERFVSTSHQSHHDNPQAVEQLFASLKLSVPVALCYCLLAWAILGSWRAMSYLFIGLIAGYFSYEFLHYRAHHSRPRLRLFKYLRKYHLLHHHQTPDLRFGVTSPVIDYLCGTFRPVRKQVARDKMR